MKKKRFIRWILGAVVLVFAMIQPLAGAADFFSLNTVVPVQAAAKTIPGTVKLLKISSPAYNKVTIRWKKTSGATHYKIAYKKVGTSKWITVATVKSNVSSYTHISSEKLPIIVGQKYVYSVRGYNSKYKTLGKINTKGLQIKTVPDKVPLKRARLNADKKTVTVSWQKTAGCDYYAVCRRTPSTGWKRLTNVPAGRTSYTDKNPIENAENIYMIRGYYSPTKVYGKYDAAGLSVKVPASGAGHTHTYKEEIIRQATCKEDGEKKLICTICNETKTERIPATGRHNWVNEGTDVAMVWMDENGIQASNEDTVTWTTCCVTCGYFYGNIKDNEDLFITRYYKHIDEPGPCYGGGYMSLPVYARYELYECPDCYSYKRGKLAYYHYHWNGSFEHTLTLEEVKELGLPLPEL